MPGLPFQRRTIGLLAVAGPLLVLFVFVVLRSGPLAPVKVTTTRVQQQSITPEIFGIGTIQARSSYKIGPVMAGKLQQLTVDVGDVVNKGQVIGQMDPVDLDELTFPPILSSIHKLAIFIARFRFLANESKSPQ